MKLNSLHRYVPEADGNREAEIGHQISASLLRLTIRDTFALQAKMREAMGVEHGVNAATIQMNLADPGQLEKFWVVVEWLIINYTKDWQGIWLDDKELIDPKEVVALCGSEHVLMLMEVANQVIQGQKGTVDDLKNSASESGPGNSDSAMTAPPASSPESSENETVEIGM